MQSKHGKTIINLLTYVIGILLICFLLPRAVRFFLPVVIGWVIAMIANPIVKFFENRLKIVRKHGTWIVIVGVLALIVTGGYFLIAWLVRESVGFLEYLPKLYETLVQGLEDIGNNLMVSLQKSKLPTQFQEELAAFFGNMDTYAGDLIEKIGIPTLSYAGDFVSSLPNLLIQTIFMFLSAYFFVADRERIDAGIRKILPQSVFDRWAWLKRMFSHAVGGYFKAQFKIMGVIAMVLFAGFLFLGVEYAALWALLIAFLDFMPFLGTGTAIWPWAAFQLMRGNYSMAVGLMILYLVCLLLHQLLQPKFVGDTVGIDPLTTLLFMFIGYRIGGILGLIIALPIGTIFVNLYKAGAFDKIIRDVRAMVKDFNEYRKSE